MVVVVAAVDGVVFRDDFFFLESVDVAVDADADASSSLDDDFVFFFFFLPPLDDGFFAVSMNK